jgi:hypothetical protein
MINSLKTPTTSILTVMPPHAMHTTMLLDDESHQTTPYFAPVTKRKSRVLTNIEPAKSVSFKKSVKVQRVLHVADYTKEERTATWYTESESAAMKQHTKESAKILETLGLRKCAANKDFCGRGLEQHTKDGSRRRSQHKSRAIQVVLLEQKRQKKSGAADPYNLAFLYLSESRHCQVLAHETGEEDAVTARRQWR